MPKETVWKAALGDLEPIDTLPTDRVTRRHIVKLLRYFRDKESMGKYDAACAVADAMATRDPESIRASDTQSIRFISDGKKIRIF